jgi:LmbE family N-acetylglucosaminyl deacetylase
VPYRVSGTAPFPHLRAGGDRARLRRHAEVGRVVVISPHLDDAVFSTWWHLTRAERVTIISVFAGIPDPGIPAPAYDRFTGSSDPRARARRRRDEDERVTARRGWQTCHLDHLDEPYRSDPVDRGRVADSISAQLPSERDLVLVPAGIGRHPDHLAARDAALLMLRDVALPVRLYADLPYAAFFGWPHWVTAAAADPFLSVDAYYEESFSTVDGWLRGDPEVHRLSRGEQRAKLRAMRAYETQFPAQEGGPSRWLSHPQRLSVEVTWPVSRV